MESYQLVLKKTTDAIEKKAEECYRYMDTEEGKKNILNPADQTPIIDIALAKPLLQEIQNRMALYIETFLKCPNVTDLFEKIQNENVLFYQNTLKQISTLEDMWISIQGIKSDTNGDSDLPWILKIPKTIVTFIVKVVLVVLSLVLGPIVLPIAYVIYSKEKNRKLKQKLIDKAYTAYMLSIQKQVRSHLHSNCGEAIELLATKMLESSFHKIQHLETLIENLQRSRNKILLNLESFTCLLKKIEAMKMSALELKCK